MSRHPVRQSKWGEVGRRPGRRESSRRVKPAWVLAGVLSVAFGVLVGCGDTSLDPPVEGSDGGGDIGSSDERPNCNDYCLLMTSSESCQGEGLDQYRDFSLCMTICEDFAGWAPGQFGQGQGNTIGCRLNAYQLAAQDAAQAPRHCATAGRTGGGVCGSYCDVYCDLMERNCQDVPTVLVERAECMRGCAEFSTAGGSTDQGGDTVQCRINHLILAGSPVPGEAALHCPHGAINALPPCTGDAPGGHNH